MILIVALIPATLLGVLWFVLLSMGSQEDWGNAAIHKVLTNRTQILELRRKEEIAREKMVPYSGVMAKVMGLFYNEDFDKKVAALEKENAAIQQGDMRSVSMLAIPGYVLQRKVEALGRGELHKKLLGLCIELYGRKYAEVYAQQLIACLTSYPIIGLALSLTLGSIAFVAGGFTPGIAVMGVGTLLILVLVYAMYDEVSDKLNKRRDIISRQFPNVVTKLALLVTSGMIMERAWRETAESSTAELYMEMRTTADELDNLMAPEAAYTNFINRCNTKETTKLASAIIQNQSKGNAEIGVLLKAMAHDAWQERRHTAKRDSEKANSKLMIPTMLLFGAILVMIMVPVALNFGAM